MYEEFKEVGSFSFIPNQLFSIDWFEPDYEIKESVHIEKYAKMKNDLSEKFEIMKETLFIQLTSELSKEQKEILKSIDVPFLIFEFDSKRYVLQALV